MRDFYRIWFLVILFTIGTNSVWASEWNLTTVYVLEKVPIDQEEIKVQGRVIDENSDPIPGASVIIKGTTTGTITDIDGSFVMEIPQGSLLVVTFLGYKSYEFKAVSESPYKIQLETNTEELDEVVVIGYGEAKKSDLTGSSASVKMDEMKNNATSNVQQYFQGRAVGVSVVENSGDPSAGVKIEIRGTNSINASTSPLYVIDGVPIETDATNDLTDTWAGGMVANPMANINPQDIANIEILKDASATAIYGSRGANGVVLITTRSGQIGKTKVDISYARGISENAEYLNLMNAEEYAEMANEASDYRMEGDPRFTEEDLANLKDFDHQRKVFVVGVTDELNMSISGGSSKEKFYVSGQYYDQTGIFRNTGLTKLNGKVSFKKQLTDKLEADLMIMANRSVSLGSVVGGWNGGILSSTIKWAPSAPMIKSDGTFNFYSSHVVDSDGFMKERYLDRLDPDFIQNLNPLAIGNGYESKNTNSQLLNKIALNYQITPNLTAQALLGYNIYRTKLQAYRATYVVNLGSPVQGFALTGNNDRERTLYQGTLSYQRTAGKHNINSVVGMSAERTVQDYTKFSTRGFSQDVTGYYDMSSGQEPQLPQSGARDYSLVSVFARSSYNYDFKYYLQLTGRFDGSSRLAQGNQWGFFPSIGLSWRLKRESFLQNVSLISELKLRTSYGVSGNQGISPYQTLSQFGSDERHLKSNYNFGNQIAIGYAPVNLPNEDLTWEKTYQANFGIDYGMFDDRFVVSGDVYRKDTRDLLFYVNVPSTSGFTNAYMNIGSLRNEGLELQLTTINIKTEKFRWTTSFNAARNRNKILKLLPGVDEIIAGEEWGAPISYLHEGEPIGRFYGYKTDGMWSLESVLEKPSTFQPGVAPGDRRYQDINQDSVLSIDDRVVIGSAIPKVIGGFSSDITYGNWSLGMQFSYSYGNKMFNALRGNVVEMIGGNNAEKAAATKRWRPITEDMTLSEQEKQAEANESAKYPRAGTYGRNEVSDFFIEDASYIRLNNVSLNYQVPARFVSRLQLRSVVLGASVQNAFTITNYSGYSPTGNSRGNDNLVRGVDNGLYPTMRTYRFSLNVSF